MKLRVNEDAQVTIPREDSISLQNGGEIVINHDYTGLKAWVITYLMWAVHEVITQGRGKSL